MAGLETLPRKCRAYSRPAGVAATMLETSRRLLTRFSTGGAPRKAQVVPGRARKLCPASSRKTTVRPSRRAFFFDRGPLASGPGSNRALVTPPGPAGRALHGKAVRLQRPLKVARVIAHAEHAPDQGRDAPQRPALGLKAGHHRPARQQPAQPPPGTLIQPPRSSGLRTRPQPAPALARQHGRPAANRRAAHTEPTGNGRLRQLAPAQQHRCCQAPFLQLCHGPARRPPSVVIHRTTHGNADL